jgi:hypothetical protein
MDTSEYTDVSQFRRRALSPPSPPTRGCVVLYQGEEVDDYYGGEREGAVYDRGYIIVCVVAVHHRGYK